MEKFLAWLEKAATSEHFLELALGWLIVVSVVSVIACVYDKVVSKRERVELRVPEKTLMALSILGGSLAMYITMQIVHHKTKHKKFMIGIPVIMVLQVTLIILYFYFVK